MELLDPCLTLLFFPGSRQSTAYELLNSPINTAGRVHLLKGNTLPFNRASINYSSLERYGGSIKNITLYFNNRFHNSKIMLANIYKYHRQVKVFFF